MHSYFKLQDCYENVFPAKTVCKKKTLELWQDTVTSSALTGDLNFFKESILMYFAGVGERCFALNGDDGRWEVKRNKYMFLDFLSCRVPCDSQWADSKQRHSLPL